MGQCLRKICTLLEESEPAPHSFKASMRARETAKATHKGNLLLTDTEILFYENKKPDPLYKWELQFVRKYGTDKKIFSIHVGTRTKTGEGQYLFRVRKAEQLGKEIEERISAMQSKYAPVVYSKRRNPDPVAAGHDPTPSSSSHLVENDSEQIPYINLPMGPGAPTEDDMTYINMENPPSKRPKPAPQSDPNTTNSYIELEPNPTGNMSPRLTSSNMEPRPGSQDINYTQIDIETSEIMANQKPIT